MSYEQLKNSRRIVAEKIAASEIEQLMDAAQREVAVAKDALSVDATLAQDTCYAAMLKAGRALMFSRGFRPRGAGQHATVVQFCRETLPRKDAVLLDTFDRLRRERHEHLYWGRELATATDAEANIEIAAKFVGAVKKKLKR